MARHDDDPAWLNKYNKIHDEVLMQFVNDSKEIGDDVAKQADLIKRAFDAHKALMIMAGKHGRPNDSDLEAILKPLSTSMNAIEDFRDKNRASKQLNFLSAVADGIPFLGWVAIVPTPSDYILQMVESAQFFANKILKEFRTSEPKLANWSTSWIKLLKCFQQYVKDNHPTGLRWCAEKSTATPALMPVVSLADCPPPPPSNHPPSSGLSVAKGDTSALFAEINKGEAITAGLKKVTKDMQTHKNPALREKVKVDSPPPRSQSTGTKSSSQSTQSVKKPPVFALQKKQWVVEWQEDNQELIIDNTNIKQTVYIFKCTNCIIQVKGKVNTITVDNCKKCGIVFEDLISACEFVNCESIKAQANGDVPTISVEKTDGAQIYLNKKSMGAQIISSKSSEMNICVTKDDGDMTEYPVVEQYKTVWDGKTFTTTPMDLTS